MLVALAALAERVAARSLPVRFLVLCILRRAETVAEEFAYEAAGMQPPNGGLAAVGNGPADALLLAARLKALAAALCLLLPDACGLDRLPVLAARASREIAPHPGLLAFALVGWTGKPYDTS
jgi:hypothetical protein